MKDINFKKEAEKERNKPIKITFIDYLIQTKNKDFDPAFALALTGRKEKWTKLEQNESRETR